MSRNLEPTLTIEQFESGQIDPEHFDHEAHVYIGWLYVREFELAVAIAKFDAGLKRLTTHLGVPEKYHATITWLFLFLIAERFDSNESWHCFRSRNKELIGDSRMTLSRYYSDALLFSERARERFLLPDKGRA